MKVISYDSSRGGISVITEKAETTTSYLLIQNADLADSGKYTCAPSNAGKFLFNHSGLLDLLEPARSVFLKELNLYQDLYQKIFLSCIGSSGRDRFICLVGSSVFSL